MHPRSLIILFLLLTCSLLTGIAVKPAFANTSSRTIVVEVNDGHVWRFDTSAYATVWAFPTGTVSASAASLIVGQEQSPSGSVIAIYRGFLFFDTAAIPDSATVTSANLSVCAVSTNVDTTFNVTVQHGQTSYPHRPLEAIDYHYASYSGDGGTVNASLIVAEVTFNITLNSDGLGWIDKTAMTKLCLRSTHDIDASEPAVGETNEVEFCAHEYNINYSRLYVTYDWTGISLDFYGLFCENGTAYSGNATVIMWFQYGSPVSFTLDAAYNAEVEQLPLYFSWNISNTAENQTRTYYLHSSDTYDFYLFIPSEPINIYLFDVLDLEGLTNGFLEISANVNGTERVFERLPLNVMNVLSCYLGWASRYNIRVRCDEGTYLCYEFTAAAVQTQTIIIPKGVFPVAYGGRNGTVSATRVNNTWVQVAYADFTYTTAWLNVTFYYKSGYSLVNAYSTNTTGSVQTLNWYGADADTDYSVKLLAHQGDTTYTWTFTVPANRTADNVWDDMFEPLGTFPFNPQNLLGIVIVLSVFGVFSWLYLPIGLLLGVLTGGLLTYLNWLDLSWTAISFALAVVFVIFIQEGKKREREI